MYIIYLKCKNLFWNPMTSESLSKANLISIKLIKIC